MEKHLLGLVADYIEKCVVDYTFSRPILKYFGTDLGTLTASIVKSKVDIAANCHTTSLMLPEIRDPTLYIPDPIRPRNT